MESGNYVWSQQQKLIPFDGEKEWYFGYTVSMYEDTLVVGAGGDSTNGPFSGSAYIYRSFDGGVVWTVMQKIIGEGVIGNDAFGGFSTSISSRMVAIGAGIDSSGKILAC